MKAKHTSGPWDINRYPNGEVTIDGPEEYRIAYVVFGDDSLEEQNEANARLIAAAPEMFEALQHAVYRWSPDYGDDGWIKKARAALSKASGSDTDGKEVKDESDAL